jgi:hypothetical protein
MWYRHSEKYTETEFTLLMAARRGFDHKEKPELLTEIDRRISNIGVFAFPYLIDEISKGELGLIPIVSELSDAEVAADASAETCKIWWEKNKERFAKPYKQGHFDTFRTWSNVNEGTQVRAKFLAVKDDLVTLEMEDGKIIKIDFKHLQWNDQNYVERNKR